MEGYRVYRLVDPPEDWRERLDLARRLVSGAALGGAKPTVRLQGQGFDLLTRAVGTLGETTPAILWGYLPRGSMAPLRTHADAILAARHPIYLACEEADAEGRLEAGARAYCAPDPTKSSLLLTIPPFDADAAITRLTAMFDVVRESGLLGGDRTASAALAQAVVREPQPVMSSGGVEIRPMGTSAHPHLVRLAWPSVTAAALLGVQESLVARCLRTVSQTYLKLQGPAAGALLIRDVAFDSPVHWKLSIPLGGEDSILPLLRFPGHLSASFREVQWAGQPSAELSEVNVGITARDLLVHVGFGVDGDAVQLLLEEAGGASLERLPDMHFD